MPKIYVRCIGRGLKTFKDVPYWYREEVYQELVRQGKTEWAVIDGKPYKESEGDKEGIEEKEVI